MDAVRLNLIINQGATFKKTLRLRQTDGTPMNITGCSLAGYIRHSFFSVQKVNFNPVIVDPLQGLFRISLTKETTEAIRYVSGVYDVEITYANLDRDRVLEGNIAIRREVTRDG